MVGCVGALRRAGLILPGKANPAQFTTSRLASSVVIIQLRRIAMNNLPEVSFCFESTQIRVVMKNGEPWFVAADVCAAVSVINHRDAIGKLDEDEKGVALTDTLGGRQEISIISESGMYTIILRCRDAIKPGTVPYRFRKWVTSEVLPQIRKTGSYCSQPALPAPPHPTFSADHANRTEIIYYQDFKPIFCRVLFPNEVVISPESMKEWLEMRGMIFFTREDLKKMTIEKIISLIEEL
jgi:prophage antirepressor-like protein